MATKTEDILVQILARLDAIEKVVAIPSGSVAKSSQEAVLRERLSNLTIKRHAVLTATLGGLSYEQIATLMGCSLTTVKLHLKSALDLLEIPSRSNLLALNKGILDPIPEREYEARYGIGKRWYMEQKPALMAVLRDVKRTANQYKRDDK